MKDKIIAKSFYTQFYNFYRIEDILLTEIFKNYLFNENLDIKERDKYIEEYIKIKLLKCLDLNNIFEPKITNYDFDPHNFNEFGIAIQKDYLNGIKFTIKTKNIVNNFEDIIEDNIFHYLIESIIWIENKFNINYNEFKTILDIILIKLNNNNNIIQNDYVLTIFNYYSNNNLQIHYESNNTKHSCYPSTFMSTINPYNDIHNKNIRIVIKIIYKFDKTNVFWNQFKDILNINTYSIIRTIKNENNIIVKRHMNVLRNMLNIICLNYII
jgi:hypothetical protein